MQDEGLKEFYEQQYAEDEYAPSKEANHHPFYSTLKAFIDAYQLQNKHLLEVGSGRGAFQDVIQNYVGIDISINAGKHLNKPFTQGSAGSLPFADNSFDAVWTYAVLEHVPNPETALSEMRRVIKPDGLLLLAPAWQCRSWAAMGYPVRPYSDFDLGGKLIKASIPIRDSVIFRSSYVFPRRFGRYVQARLSSHPVRFHYKEIQPNYVTYWMSDSDAVNSMDPYDAILWFHSRGDQCLSHLTNFRQFFVRTGSLIFRIKK